MSHDEAMQALFDQGLRIAHDEPGWFWVFIDKDGERISWWVVDRR